MPSPLEQAGSRPQKETRFAPIHTNRFFTGLWTNRNALRDAATAYLYEKFYSGSRFDSLIGGSNMELNTKLTLWRRAGNSVYNDQVFAAVNRFFGFRISSVAQTAVRVLADTAAAVYDATGPHGQTILFNKAAGAGQTSFQDVGNVLYMGDGVDQMKWVQSLLAWLANTSYNAGDFLVDANGNLQIVSGITAPITNVAIGGNILTLTVAQNFQTGARVTLSGLTTATFLNGVSINVVSQTATQITANFTHADYPAAADTGIAVASSGSGTSGAGPGAPAFSAALNGTVTDNQLIWLNRGSAVRQWQIAAQTSAPSVANAALAGQFGVWVANTWFSPNLLIVDNQATPCIQKLTQGGTLGGAQPAWNAGGTGSVTNDNTAQWTNQGVAAWQANHVYKAGDFVAVTYTVSVTIDTGGDGSGDISPTFGSGGSPRSSFGGVIVVTTTYNDFFKCTQGGTSSNPGPPKWATGIGTNVQDNTVIWTNQGAKVLWGNIGAAALVSVATAISDPNGNIQNVTIAGKSGAVIPTFAASAGVSTVDNTITWQNGGPSGQGANTGAWQYAFAGIDDVTGDITTATSRSVSITKAANSYIQVSGQGFGAFQIGKIRIYRTAQNGGTLLKLADIPNPVNVPFTYSDINTDDNLSKFIQASENGVNNPPPTGINNLAFHAGRTWGSVGNVTFYSAGSTATEGGQNKGFTSWPPNNSFTWSSKVIRQVPTAIGLIVLTLSDVNIVTGDGINTPFTPSAYLKGIGLRSYNGFGQHGSIMYLLDSRRRLITLDPSSGVSHVGLPIADQLKLFDDSQSYVTYHTEDGTDEGLYVGDGSTGWFKMIPTPAPETGIQPWSPKATIVGGIKALQTVEVAPGVHKLLMWQASTGQILQRDLTTNQDNGSNYADCFANIGSIVLAQMGQVAEMEFIGTELPRQGSRPSVNVRLGEIAGKFYGLPYHVKDPPYLVESSTLYADRWYFSATQKPAWCRHLQIQISFPAENVQNEVLTYTIFGAIHQEK